VVFFRVSYDPDERLRFSAMIKVIKQTSEQKMKNHTHFKLIIASTFHLLTILLAINTIASTLPKTNWTIWAVDSEELIGVFRPAENAIDNDPSTLWHTEWFQSDPPPPHEIQINMGATYTVNGFRYLPRQDGSKNGRVNLYEFYVSNDGLDWGAPVASGSYINDDTEKEILFPEITTQFVRFRALTEVNGNPFTSAAEISVLGDPATENIAPDGTIISPAANITVNIGDSIDFAGSGNDPDNDVPLTYLWSFGDPAIPDSSNESPGLITFNTTGTYTVTFTTTDALGLVDPTPASINITVLDPLLVADLIPKTNWTIWAVDSEELIGVFRPAENAIDNDPSTLWHTEWFQSDPPPPHEIQINMGATYTVNGFRYLPRQDGSENGRVNQYEFYVSNDGLNWGAPVASGAFINDNTEKEILFPGITTQFVRFRALTEVNATSHTSAAEISVLGDPAPASAPAIEKVLLPQDLWTLRYVDSEETIFADLSAGHAFDGNKDTIWHTEWYSTLAHLPHEIQIDLGQVVDIDGFQYLPRPGGGNGQIAKYDFYVSLDGSSWGNPVASGTFSSEPSLKEVTFSTVSARFIRFVAKSEINGRQFTSVAEINLIQLQERIIPSVKITEPTDYYLQTSTNLTVKANAYLDDMLHSGWGVKFILDGGIAFGGYETVDYKEPFETTFTGLAQAEHDVKVVLVDKKGTEIFAPDSSDQIGQVGIGHYFVAIGDSITRADVTDDDPSNNVSLDGRNTGGGYEPVLNNLLTASTMIPHTVINAGVGGDDSGDGLSLLPYILKLNPNAQFFLIQFGTNDAISSLPRPSGLGLSINDPGYPGSFKDNMQQIIAMIMDNGKEAYLAKIPIVLGSCSSCTPYPNPETGAQNIIIRKYNQVIDELVLENGILTIPPDFYLHFSQNMDQFFDNYHPNGDGYNSMAELWFNSLTQ